MKTQTNEKLVSAAPVLLEALLKLSDAGALREYAGHGTDEYIEALQFARKAIAYAQRASRLELNKPPAASR